MIAFALTKISFDDVTRQISPTNYLATNNEKLSLEDFMQTMNDGPKEIVAKDKRTSLEAQMNATHEAGSVSNPMRTIQPAWVRISHWLNALAAILMMLSGWRIYDASPVFKGFVIPTGITLGGWLGGALQWHFAAMWLLFFNGIFYLAMNVVTGRLKRKFFPLSPRAILHDLGEALKGHLSHAELMGGYDFARVVHFSAMSLLAAFIVVHLVMVSLVPRSLLTMIRGR